MTADLPAPPQPRRRLSVVIPCLNDADLLVGCLEAFANQTIQPDEIIVVDNGSSDDSAAVARAAGATVVDEPRRGITYATKTGFDAATGDVMLRTDTDVLPAPDFVARLHQAWDHVEQLEHAHHSSTVHNSKPLKVVAVTGGGRFMIPGLRGDIFSWLYLSAYRTLVGAALGHQPLFGTNYCLRRDFWERVSREVDFTDTFVHEDMHISFAVRPEETVWLQEDLVLPMDDRALKGAAQVKTRFQRGMHTITSRWKTEAPWERLAARGKLPELLTRLMPKQRDR